MLFYQKMAKIDKPENGTPYAFYQKWTKLIDKFEKGKKFSHGNAQKLL